MKKWLLLTLLYLPALIFLLLYRNEILTWAQDHANYFNLTLIATLFALFPVLPYKLVIGLLGYSFGAAMGGIVTWLGTTIASIMVYIMFRWLFQEKGRLYLERVPILSRLTALFEQHTFSTILLARMLPIIPQMGVNIYAGTASLPFWHYLLATSIGKIPSIALYAYAGGNLLEHPLQTAGIALIYVIMLVIAFAAYKYRFFKI
ncbi:TVP38/TMEM64 family protein [Paenibacillus urinalis]|uniref:TVP38/TMEM64 family membrane protein n=1 Tax=Paenibacillus urinalis TaxID=521520 RepID=A0AAX3MVD5_9BACL|nr:VTT domain-containing protein [Paenibacillus urinalis]WDH81373.1 VTT domain-containing protein [Paenibacillus urinalis]